MRHRVGHRKLGRTTSHRWAMFRNMATSLVEHERITTTLSNAKELRSFADKLVTLGKKNTLAARRQALSFIRSNDVVRKLFSELAPRFKDRNGGYTRIFKLGYRHGDSAAMAILEYLPDENKKVEEAPKGKAKKAVAAKAKPKAAAKKPAKKEEPKAAKKEEKPAKKKEEAKKSEKKAEKAPAKKAVAKKESGKK